MSDNGIVWEEPPEVRHGGHSQWLSRLAPVLERPGEWCRVHETTSGKSARSTVARLNHGRVGLPAPGKWEFVSRTKDGHGYVYARYLGPS